MKSLLLGFIGALAAIVMTVFVYIGYADYRAVAETSEMLNLVAPFKAQIEEMLVKQTRLDVVKAPASLVTSNGRFIETVVLESGTILLRGGSDGQVVVLIPTRTGNTIVWRCVGGSGKAMPSSCRAVRQK